MPVDRSVSDLRLPEGHEIFLDHIGHFIPDIAAARAALAQSGFQVTPVSIQENKDADGTCRPTGTGNITAMLQQGYIEVLFKTADTPLGREFDDAMADYAGVHLAAFAVRDARAQSQRLKEAGFRVRPAVELKRPVKTEVGEAEAAFTVARVEHGEMPEGRMQYLTHHSEDAVWQTRWLTQPNGADTLLDIVMAVENVDEAAARFGRFLFHDATATKYGRAVLLERGGVQLVDSQSFGKLFPGPCPRLPFAGLYGVRVASVDATSKLLTQNGAAAEMRGKSLFVPFPEALGRGAWYFAERDIDLPWRGS